MKKKVIAVLLSLSLAAGSVPGYAMAEEPGGPEGEIVVVEEEGPQEAAAPEEPEMEEAAELPEEAPAEDALIVEDGVEIAGIEELEIPAEDAVAEDEPVVTDEIAVDTAEVSEDPEIELVGDENAEEADVVDPDSERDPDKTNETAYTEHLEEETDATGQVIKKNMEARLVVEFRDREIEEEANSGNGEYSYVVNADSNLAAKYVETGTGWRYYWIDTGKTVVYDPTYKTLYNSQDPRKAMDEALPQLRITWTKNYADDPDDETTKVDSLVPGVDYTYYLVNEDAVNYEGDSEHNYPRESHGAVSNAAGNAGAAVVEIHFRGHYGNLSPLRMQYKIEAKSLNKTTIKDNGEMHEVKVNITDPEWDSTDEAYHFYYYDGQPHVPSIESVKYKDVPLKQWTSTNPAAPNTTTNDDWYTVTLKAEANKDADLKDVNDVKESVRASDSKIGGKQYYTMVVTGYQNYRQSAEYKYIIHRKEIEDKDVSRLDNKTFYVELNEEQVEKQIRDSLINTLENLPLDTTENNDLDDYKYKGYKIYYYKIVDGEEIPFTTENFPDVPGVKDDGTGAPGFDDINGNGVFDATDPTKPGDKTPYEKRINPTTMKDVNAVCGRYTYHIEFTGNGNFVEKKAKDSPIVGRFTITNEEPHLKNVYDSLEDELVKAINDVLDPTYDATDWFDREGGDYDRPNDVEEMVVHVFNTYTYKKKNSAGEVIPCKAGDNIKVSLHPKHKNGMIDAGEYVIRIEGINDWKDDLGGDGYIYMDKPNKMAKVDPRSLDFDDNDHNGVSNTSDRIDYAGNGASKIGDYVDRFYIRTGAKDNLNADADNVERYTADTDRYKEDDIYKYGAVQYLTEYKGDTYDDPIVTITHLVRNTEDMVEDGYKDYPLSINQDNTNLYVGLADSNSNVYYQPEIVRAREKVLKLHEDFEIASVVEGDYLDKDHKALRVTRIRGINNYQGTIILPTIQRKMINLESDQVTVRVKSQAGPDEINTADYVVDKAVPKGEGGLDLRWGKGAGIDVLPENVQVTFTTKSGKVQTLDPSDYHVVIDERSVNHLCQDCRTVADGIGRHVTAGWHQILVTRSERINATGFKEAKFYIRSNLDFGADYEGVWDDKKIDETNEKAGKTIFDKDSIPVGRELKKDEAPHNYVKVVNRNSSETVQLNYGTEYAYECYITKDEWEDAYDPVKKTLDKEKVKTAIWIDVETPVEFQKSGDWYLVFKPVNRTGTRVEEYEGYVLFPFTVQKKDFVRSTEKNDEKIEVVVKEKYKDGITWPGSKVTGPEVAEMLYVEDTQKVVNAELKYGEDYTIKNVIEGVGPYQAVLVGMGNYKDSEILADVIEVKKASLKNAEVGFESEGTEVGGVLYYKQEPFSGPLTEKVDKDSLKLKVTAVLKNDIDGGSRTVELSDGDYTVNADSETGNVDADVKITVTGTGNYESLADKSATAKIVKANIEREDIFNLTGIPTEPKVYKGDKVELTLNMTDKRNNKVVGIVPSYSGNDRAGKAVVTITPSDLNSYEGSLEKTFTLIEQEQAGRIELNAESFPYKNDTYKPEDVIKAVYNKDNVEIPKGSYSAVIKGEAKNVKGDHAVAVTIQADGKDVVLEKAFTITPLEITEVTNLKDEYVYTGNVIRPAVKAVQVLANHIILQNDDFVIYNTENEDVGEKELIVQGKENYTGTIKKTFKVVAASVAGAGVTGVKAKYKYNGEARQPKVKVTVSGRVLKKDVDYKVTYSADSTTVGGKTATIEGIGNYTGSQVKAYSVVPAKAVVKSVKAGKQKLTVKVNAQAGVKYQIQYKVSGDSTWSSAKTAETKKVLKHLTSGKKYDIRVRAFATIDGARVNGAWSKITVKKVK